MAWLEVHQSLPSHRKVLRLADLLKVPVAQAMGLLVSFWLWAIDNSPDGSLEGISAWMISRAAQWEGDPDLFYNSMIGAGWLDDDGENTHIHNWSRYTGKLLERRAKDKERMAKWREKEECYANETRNVRVTNGVTVPNSTLQYQKNKSLVGLSTDEEEVTDETSTEKKKSKIPYEGIVSAWNEVMVPLGRPRVNIVTEQRKRRIKALCVDRPEIGWDFREADTWKEFFRYCARSRFLMSGEWAFTLDWVIRPDRFIQIVEGNFHQEGGKKTRWQKST
jgi:hypothetical protein